MKIKVNSAELVRYNANNRGASAPDCVKRAISLAFDLPYSEVAKLLNAKMKEKRKRFWNIPPVYSEVVYDLGGKPFVEQQGAVTVSEFADTIADPNKAYVMEVGKNLGKTTHLVCVRDGKVWDSWDSRDWYVGKVSEVGEGVQRKQVTDIKDNLEAIAKENVYPTLSTQLVDYMHKKDWEGRYEYSLRIRDYTLKTVTKLTLYGDGYLKDRVYNIQINLTIEPTMTDEEAAQFIRKMGKQRMYDRLWAINEQEKKLVEEAQLRHEIAKSGGEQANMKYWLDGREQKFYNTLPGWFKALITFLFIENPDQYHDSYTVKFKKHPKDDLHPDEKSFTLTGYTASELRDKIERYGKTFEIDGIDYHYDY